MKHWRSIVFFVGLFIGLVFTIWSLVATHFRHLSWVLVPVFGLLLGALILNIQERRKRKAQPVANEAGARKDNST